MHARFPNPYGDRFSKEWLKTYTATFLKNKKATIRRAVKEQLRYPGQNKRGGNVHDVEWDFALDEARSGKDYKQQREARAGQTPTHWGSGGKTAWKDKYVSF